MQHPTGSGMIPFLHRPMMICALCMVWVSSLKAQLNNTSFRREAEQPSTTWGGTFEGLQYLKNNEYFNHLNPGETLFGFQVKGLIHYRFHPNATMSAGVFLQQEFGD